MSLGKWVSTGSLKDLSSEVSWQKVQTESDGLCKEDWSPALQDFNWTGRCTVFSSIQDCFQDSTKSKHIDRQGYMACIVLNL